MKDKPKGEVEDAHTLLGSSQQGYMRISYAAMRAWSLINCNHCVSIGYS